MTSVSHTPTNVSQNADTTDSRTDTNGITTSQKDWILQVQKWIKTPRESLRGRFKVVLDAEVINYLVSISQKKIAPETSITSVVHEAGIDPNFTLGAARNDEELAAISNGFVTAFTKTGLVTRRKSLYHDRQDLQSQDAPRRPETLRTSAAHWDDIKGFIVVTLPAAIDRGPFIAGTESEVDDFHVAAWLARIAYVVGAQKSDEGVSALEQRFRPIPHKIEVLWGT
ncbi:hypothetical protein BC827DRAFT_1271179 [Russula dissimulans]|nr:hypothetical protein BC827DRAFT_1271179 [Russula dissimulans]